MVVNHGHNLITQKTAGQWVTKSYDSFVIELESLAPEQLTARFIRLLDSHVHAFLQKIHGVY